MMTMSERKNLKWICRRCERTKKGLEVEHSTELEKECSFCGTQTWCFLVASSRLVKSKPPSEVPAEPESIEVNEAIEEVIEEAVEAEMEVEEQLKESPEETAPAEGLEPTEEEVVAESPETEVEAEPEPSEKDAEIARLEAQLKELQK
jgi:hypothetical protein